MNDLRIAAQQLLDACEQRLPLQGQAAIIDELNSLRAALAEPVAGVVLNEEGRAALVEHGREEWHCVVRNARRLYAAPPQPAEPLSEVDLRALYDRHAACQEEGPEISGWWDFARAIERAHGIGGEE